MEELISICEKYIVAREQYENAARAQVRNASLLHDKTLFWKMVEDLRESVIAFISDFICSYFHLNIFDI